MKYLLFFSLSLAIISSNIANAQSNLLSKIDTNIVIYYNNEPLRYRQYMDLLETGEFNMFTDLRNGYKNIRRELIKYTPAQKLKIKMDKASIERRIAGLFGIQEELPLAQVDTAIIIYNTDGKPLKYYQYAPMVLSKQFFITHDKGKRYLKSMGTNMLKIAGADTTMLKAMEFAFNGASGNNQLYWGLMKADHIRVEKSKRKMYLERNGKLIYEFPINLGKHPIGHKQKEGDGRTPEGSYFIDYNINSKAAYNLGFHISYPNEQDLLNAKKLGVKPGGDVMIHGTSPERSKLKDWTNGCIAISNSDIDTLVKYYYNSIPIQINK